MCHAEKQPAIVMHGKQSEAEEPEVVEPAGVLTGPAVVFDMEVNSLLNMALETDRRRTGWSTGIAKTTARKTEIMGGMAPLIGISVISPLKPLCDLLSVKSYNACSVYAIMCIRAYIHIS